MGEIANSLEYSNKIEIELNRLEKLAEINWIKFKRWENFLHLKNKK